MIPAIINQLIKIQEGIEPFTLAGVNSIPPRPLSAQAGRGFLFFGAGKKK